MNIQEAKEQLLAIKKSNDLVYEANGLMDDNNFISAEKEYLCHGDLHLG